MEPNLVRVLGWNACLDGNGMMSGEMPPKVLDPVGTTTKFATSYEDKSVDSC